MNDVIDRATRIIREMRQQQHSAEMIARALDAAGLLAGPEHDAAVAAGALRDAADEWHEEMAGTAPRPHRWLYARADRIEREAGESGADA